MEISFEDGVRERKKGKLGVWGTVLSLMSTVIGGGIVCIPWATYQCGLVVTVLLCCMAALQVMVSCALFLQARELCHGSAK